MYTNTFLNLFAHFLCKKFLRAYKCYRITLKLIHTLWTVYNLFFFASTAPLVAPQPCRRCIGKEFVRPDSSNLDLTSLFPLGNEFFYLVVLFSYLLSSDDLFDHDLFENHLFL